MNSNQQAKQVVVEEIKEKIQKSKSLTFVDYKGISVKDDTALRASFRNNGAEYRVYKNRLLGRALTELGITGCEQFLNGTTAVAFGYADEVVSARLAMEGVSKNEKLSIKFGIYDGKIMSVEDVKTLSKIPPKPVLIAQLLSMLNAPVSGLARALEAIAKK
ncbi:MAG: 50S ribosomal protein L10 [Clostridia bacterium]